VTSLANGTVYTFTVTASNVAGPSAPSSPSNETTPWPPLPSTYLPVEPARILDTRTGNGLAGAFTSRVVRTFQVAGRGGVPAGVTAVTGTLTVTGQTAAGWLTVGPSASDVGGHSTLNFPAGDNRANGVTVALSPGGTLSIVYDGAPSWASTHVAFDVTGYFDPRTLGAGYATLTPNRLLDTRIGNGLGGAFQAGIPRIFQVSDRNSGDPSLNVPATAIAVTGTLTVTQQSWPGWLTVTPTLQPNPPTSTLNFPVNDHQANGVTVPLGPGGTLSVVYNGAPSWATAHVIFDVTGYFAPGGAGARYVPLLPSRILDSRFANGLTGTFQMGISRSFTVVDRALGETSRNVPAGAIAVTGNLTVTGQTRAGWLTVTPFANNHPPTSTLNFPINDNRATGVTVALGAGRLAVVYNGAAAGDTTHAIFDVTGYFVPGS
jgi:hypothetical protein